MEKSNGYPAGVREALSAQLNEITAGIDTLDVNVREKIATLAKDLEEGRTPTQTSQ